MIPPPDLPPPSFRPDDNDREDKWKRLSKKKREKYPQPLTVLPIAEKSHKPNPPRRIELTLESCYRDLQGAGPQRASAENLIGRRCWIYSLSDFDRRTGEMLQSTVSRICTQLDLDASLSPSINIKDRLFRIISHVRKPLRDVLKQMHERLARGHSILPIRAVREIDSTSFLALSRRPGRTVREKLADRPYMLAVERSWTQDSSENRLTKALSGRLAELLRARPYLQSSHPENWLEEYASMLDGWLHSPAAKSIGRWENLPPNNVLLQHRDYRRLWDAWHWSETLDADLLQDQVDGFRQWTTIFFWKMVSSLASTAGVRLLEQPCFPNYENFAIATALGVSDQIVVVTGVMCTSLTGRSIGVVSRFIEDRKGNKSGFVRLKDEKLIIIDRKSFVSIQEYEGIRPGTDLVFDIIDMDINRPRATSAEVIRKPAGVKLSLRPGRDITITLDGDSVLDLQFEPAGPVARMKLGSQWVVAELSLEKAATLAGEALRVGLGLNQSPIKPPLDSEATYEYPPPVPFCAIDLCQLRPRFSNGERRGILPFRLLWQLWRTFGQEFAELDLGTAQAISLPLNDDVTTISIYDLLWAESPLPSEDLIRAARGFSDKLARYISTDILAYIIPDATDEFAMETLRRSINSSFGATEPLPRSIATVFAWQATAGYLVHDVKRGDCVLVLDTVGNALSATPLHARHNPKLAICLPEFNGIYWERSPTVLLGNGITSSILATEALEQSGCQSPELPAWLFGLHGLLDEESNLSWQDNEGGWFTPPFHLGQTVTNILREKPMLWQALVRELEPELVQLGPTARIFILNSTRFLSHLRLGAPSDYYDHPVLLVDEEFEPCSGGAALHNWQTQAGDIALWRDHLPELSMRIIKGGRKARFYLVKDETIAPRRGSAVPIHIEETFVLPAGPSEFRFPLLKGDSESEMQYEALLRSPSFPLEHDIEVNLHLTYTYGSDTPYDLIFRPVIENPNISFVRAEWRKRDHSTQALPSHFPELPEPHSWSKMTRFPKPGSSDTNDLLDWIRSGLEHLDKTALALDLPRQQGIVTGESKMNAKKMRYLFAKTDGRDVYCHESEFVDTSIIDNLNCGDIIYFSAVSEGSRVIGRAITRGNDQVSENRALERLAKGLVDDMRRLRFPMRTVWSEGRTLSDLDSPPEFRDIMYKGVQALVSLQVPHPKLLKHISRRVAEEALYLLCLLHRDAPSEAFAQLTEIFPNYLNERLKQYQRSIAHALGGGDLTWQSDLLGKVLFCLQDTSRRISAYESCLSIINGSLWRCGKVLDALSNSDLELIIERLIFVLQETQRLIESDPPGWSPVWLKDHLELVLGLLRTRGSEDAERRRLLDPGTSTTRALAKVIDQILDSASTRNLPLNSRLLLAVNKPLKLSNTPDLLYALTLYLTGDDSASAIRVLEIKEDGNEMDNS